MDQLTYGFFRQSVMLSALWKAIHSESLFRGQYSSGWQVFWRCYCTFIFLIDEWQFYVVGLCHNCGLNSAVSINNVAVKKQSVAGLQALSGCNVRILMGGWGALKTVAQAPVFTTHQMPAWKSPWRRPHANMRPLYACSLPQRGRMFAWIAVHTAVRCALPTVTSAYPKVSDYCLWSGVFGSHDSRDI